MSCKYVLFEDINVKTLPSTIRYKYLNYYSPSYLDLRQKNPTGVDYDASWKNQDDGGANTDGPRPMVGGGMAPTGNMVARYVTIELDSAPALILCISTIGTHCLLSNINLYV